MPNRQAVTWLVLGALAYYGFARWRGAIDGMPWAPVPAARRQA